MFNFTKITAVLIVVGCVAWSNAVRGQEPGASEELNEFRKLQQKSQQIQNQLGQIEQRALEANPKLRQMQADLQEFYYAKLVEYGYPDEDEMQKLREMQQKLQNADDMEEVAREELAQKFRAEVMKLQQAQEQARHDKEVVQKHRQYEETKLKAMNEVDEKSGQLQQQLGQLQQKMQQLQQQMYGQEQ